MPTVEQLFFLSVVNHVIFYIVIFVKIKWNKIFYKVYIPINNVYYSFLLISIVNPTKFFPFSAFLALLDVCKASRYKLKIPIIMNKP